MNPSNGRRISKPCNVVIYKKARSAVEKFFVRMNQKLQKDHNKIIYERLASTYRVIVTIVSIIKSYT